MELTTSRGPGTIRLSQLYQVDAGQIIRWRKRGFRVDDPDALLEALALQKSARVPRLLDRLADPAERRRIKSLILS